MTHLLTHEKDDYKITLTLTTIASGQQSILYIHKPELIAWELLTKCCEVVFTTKLGSECVIKRRFDETSDRLTIIVTGDDSYLFKVDVTKHNQFWKEYLPSDGAPLTYELHCRTLSLMDKNKPCDLSFIVERSDSKPFVIGHQFRFPSDMRELILNKTSVIGIDEKHDSKLVIVNEEDALIFVYISRDPAKFIKISVNREKLNGFLD